MSFAEDMRRTLATLRDQGGPIGHRIADRMASRSCGPCRACCSIKAVYDYQPPKPARTPCASLCARGCGIYGSRPQTCRDYLCAWRCGLGGSEARPDRIGGLIVDLAEITQGDPDARSHTGIVGITIHGNGVPYDSEPIGRMLEEASAVGIRFVAFSDPADDLVPTDLRFDADEKRINVALVIHSTTGKAPTGWSKPVRRKGNE